MHLVRGPDALSGFDRGGFELVGSTAKEFAAGMRVENHTLKRALTDPRILPGIGNAYSDEILHRARMSPFKQTESMSDDDFAALHRTAIDSEANYCAQCQTGGKLLADRSLSRLLERNWPRTLEELEERRSPEKPSGRPQTWISPLRPATTPGPAGPRCTAPPRAR
jgi:formamidopyrimidine-DNA glycosylase